MASGDARRKLLMAAAKVAARGADNFTIDAVAAAADVSKGGVLHHFPTKEALGVALVEAALDAFEQSVSELAATLEGPSNWSRAFVRASVAMPAGDGSPRLARAFLVAAAPESALIEPVRRRYAAWTDRMAAEIGDDAIAALIRCLADGCWWADLLEAAPLSAKARATLVVHVDRLLAAT